MYSEPGTHTADPGTAVIPVGTPLTLGVNLDAVRVQTELLLKSGVTRVVVDLSGCAYCDSSGLGFLVQTRQLLTGEGGAMRLCGVSRRIRDLLKLTRTDSLLPCDEDRQASLKAISEAGKTA